MGKGTISASSRSQRELEKTVQGIMAVRTERGGSPARKRKSDFVLLNYERGEAWGGINSGTSIIVKRSKSREMLRCRGAEKGTAHRQLYEKRRGRRGG